MAFKKCLLAAHAAAAVLYAAAIELPPDETGLDALLEDRLIDTLQYEQLFVYYALPLSVPHGELAILARIFPDVENQLPDPGQLEAYRPFDNRQIQRLFNDFPALAGFEPILRFNAPPPRRASNGEVVFGINRSSVEELRGHRARFSVKNRGVSVEGSLALNDSGAMWQTRRVEVSRTWINAQAGNFKQPIPGELFFGRFSSAAVIDEERPVESNWLYGGSGTWNGASVNVPKIPWAPMVGGGAFYHVRGDETGAGGAVNLRAGRGVTVNAAVTVFADPEFVPARSIDSIGADAGSAADLDDRGCAGKYVCTAHLYGEYKGKTWRTVIETGLPVGRENVVPALSYRLGYRAKETSAEYGFASYPDSFAAPMSRLKRRLLAEIGEKESARSPAIQKHSLKMTVPVLIPFAASAKFTPEIDFTEHQGAVRRVYGQADLRVRAQMTDFTLRHSVKIFADGADSALHTSRVSLSLRTGRPISMRAVAQSVYGYYEYSRNTYSLELAYSGLPNTVVTPFVRGRYARDHEYWLGFKSELHLYQKTWTGITVEVPVGVKGVYVKGSSSYAF